MPNLVPKPEPLVRRAIPIPTDDPGSLLRTVKALVEQVNILSGQTNNKEARAVTVADLKPEALK